MTVDEEIDQNIWWALQAIRREWVLAPAGQNIEINKDECLTTNIKMC